MFQISFCQICYRSIPSFNLPNLQLLYLYNNLLSGGIPNFNLPNLKELFLFENPLGSNIPSFNLSNLEKIIISNNQLSGSIPNFNLPNLKFIYLNNNQLSGSIPNFNLPNLLNLRLDNNNLNKGIAFTTMPLLGTSTDFYDSLTVYNNHLTFDDILPNISLISGFNGGKAQYAPQDSIFSDTLITRIAGQALTIDLDIDAGISTNVYKWYKNGQLWQTVTGVNKWTFMGLLPTDAGEYWVSVTNPNAPLLTLKSRKITIIVQPYSCASLQGVSILPANTAFCTGKSTILAPTGTWTTFNWSNGQSTPTINVNTAGQYRVTVTNSDGCTLSDTIIVAQNALPMASILNSVNTGCIAPTGSIDLNVTDGTGGYTYLWSNNTILQDITAAPAGTYTVTTPDANGCTTTTTSEILQGSPPPIPVIAGSTVLCNGTASLQTGIFSQYLWSNSQTTQSITVGQSGNYSVTVTDANGCTGTAIASIGVGGAAPTPQIIGPTAICSGASVLTTDSFAAYNWSTGATTAAITATLIGNYGLTVTAQNGCTGTAIANITTTADAPLPVIVGTNTLCNGSTTLHISGNYPNPPKWSTGETSDSISVQNPGNYGVTVTDNNGCTGTDSATIIQGGNFTVTATADGNTSFCEGSNVPLKSTPATGQTYQWQRNGSNIPNATAANYLADSTGNYTLLVTIDGCTSTSTPIAVTVLPAPKITILAIEKALCGDNTGSIEIALGNAFGNVTYAWSNGAITKNTKDMAPGQYQITVTNGNACTSTASIAVEGTVPPQPEIVGSSKIKPGETLVLGIPLDYAQYEWSNGKVSPSIEITLPGIYSVTVTDADGCTGTATKEVETDTEDLLKDVELVIPRAFSPYTTPGENDGFDPVKALIDARRPVNLAKEIRLTVYARNGEALVILSPYPEGGWSGELIPPNLPEGAYYYVLEFVFEDGKKAIYKAALNLAK
jgi:hypothetical protein